MNTRTKKYDDLTVINGVGPARQEWLISKFGIRTFHDLAAISPDEILAQLKVDGLFTSRGEVEKWVAKAAAFAEAEPRCPPGEWAPFASFVVEFQARPGKDGAEEYCTAVQHMESEIEQKWQGIETGELCRWMRERAEPRLAAESKPPEQLPASPAHLPKVPHLSLAVRQVQIIQPPQAAEPAAESAEGQMFQSFITAGVPFALRVKLSVSGLNGINLQEHSLTGSVKVYVREHPFGEQQILGEAVPFSPGVGKGSYQAGIADISLPAAIYTFKILARLEADPPVLVTLEAPLLQVY